MNSNTAAFSLWHHGVKGDAPVTNWLLVFGG